MMMPAFKTQDDADDEDGSDSEDEFDDGDEDEDVPDKKLGTELDKEIEEICDELDTARNEKNDA
eukprot:3955064-Ditylum_brightwellii.AAC.1